MKKIKAILVLLITLLTIQKGFSQVPNDFKMPDMSPYVGTWTGTIGFDTLTVELQLNDFFHESLGRNIRVLFGDYEFKSKSNVQIDSDINEFKLPLKLGIIQERDGKKFIGFTFRDKVLGKTGILRLYIDEENNDKLDWYLSYGEVRMLNATQAKINERKRFSVPNEITLYRIK
jgi:hypothetical protein